MGRDDATGLASGGGQGGGHLTAREVEVLRLAALGLPSHQIAAHLGISRRTVDDHLSVMRRRARARNRGELIARGYAAEILVGWPPRWSGRRSLLIRQRRPGQSPDVQAAPPGPGPAAAGAPRVSENAARNPRCPVTPDALFLDTCGGAQPAPAGPGETVPGAAGPPRATGALIGYARASLCGQHLNRQIEALRAAGCHSIFADQKPGKNSERRELRRLLDAARPGDILVVASLARLSRSVPDLIGLVAGLRDRGVGFKTLQEGLDTTAPGGQLIFDVFGALAALPRELIAEGTREGLSTARSRGRAGGRPTVMTAEKITAARALLAQTTIAAIARQIGVSRGTLYAHMDAITAGRHRSNSKAHGAA